ncbi:DUF29 domain-containing protein [Methylobacterium sp. BTF04]|uniref:DUF29 family protein n=1 Tax=Methylobacterium sp. BTF04 TaxID=2708300 RepID=UPI0013D327D2|nr:DUF29 domain-containing protein [Methylobacterium sp. BTF04]
MAHPKRVANQDGADAPYEADLAAWALEQASYLRARAWSKLDLSNLIEEVEAVARTERNALTSAFRIILLHMLKWDHQPSHQTRSWSTSIRVQRLAALERLEDSPSLSAQVDQLMTRAYRKARIEAADETGLAERIFPEACPYTLDEILNRAFPWS